MRIRGMLCLLVVLAAGAPVTADNHYGSEGGPDQVIAAVIDSGLEPRHQEFDYRGSTSTDDQIVAWWNFTDPEDGLPLPGQAWDPRYEDPFDGFGHGTATASLLGGLNMAGPELKSPSFAPGVKLAVAKVCDSDGTCSGSLDAAILWAVDTVKADVISISIGSIVPFPDALSGVNEAADYARQAGVLVVVSNGNGIASTGTVPSPGFASLNADSPYVLSVGASEFIWQAGFSTDPEVVAEALDVPVASIDCNECYDRKSGTSFAAPLVAGMAASALEHASNAGRTIEPDVLETLLKGCARDTIVPPNWEGYGIMDEGELGCIRSHASAGTLPPRPDPDPNALYVDTVILSLRRTWADTLDRGLLVFQALPAPQPKNGPGRAGFGFAAGIAEGDRFAITLSRGETVSAGLSVGGNEGGFEVFAFRGAGPSFSGVDLVARSGWVYEASGGISFRAPDAGAYTLLVVQWTNVFPEQVQVTDYALDVTTSDATTSDEVWEGEAYYALDTTYLG